MATNRHSAEGPAAGFVYQFERALNWLAQKEAGSSIGIETGDDITVRGPHNSELYEQDKHSLSGVQPFGDRSPGLWKTLATWMEISEARQRPIDGSVSFLFVTNSVVPACIVRRIADAASVAEVEACLVELHAAGQSPPKHIAEFVRRVLRPESCTMLRAMIGQIGLADASCKAASKELREATIAHLQLPGWCSNLSDSIADELLGWLCNTVVISWREGRPGWLERDHFVNQLHAIISRRQRQISRERAELLIPVTEEKVGREMRRPFVQQLHLITDDDVVVNTAIREFIRCNIEKARLSKEGNITDDDWREFESTLVARWSKIRSRIKRLSEERDERDIGFELLTETTESYREKLAGMDTDQVYLTSGTYHRLADLLTVGWHPKFEVLMRELLESL
jgi:hypothetical protein